MKNPLVILGAGLGAREDIPELAASPEFRKCTPKMQLASVSIRRALESLQKHKNGSALVDRGALGFVLNSGYGELEATTGFLKTFSETGVARPMMFQNSLHNSTTGFCAIHFGLEGPALTLNHRVFGGEHAILLAETLLVDGDCDACLVTTVETVPEEFANLTAPGIEGAASLIVARQSWAEKNGLSPLGKIDGIECFENDEGREAKSSVVFASLYKYDALFRINGKLSQPADFTIEKPVGGHSKIRFS